MFSIDISIGNTFSIDNENVSYKSKLFKIKEIDKLRISTKKRYLVIWLGDEHGREMKIHFFGLSKFTSAESFQKVDKEINRIVVPVILQKFNNSFNRGESITMGDCTINKEGIAYIKTTLSLSKINSFLRWQDAEFYYDSPKMIIKDGKKIVFGTIRAFDVRKTWNAILLEQLKPSVLTQTSNFIS